MGKSTISMAIFNCYVSSPEGIINHPFWCWSVLICQFLGPRQLIFKNGSGYFVGRGFLCFLPSEKKTGVFWSSFQKGLSSYYLLFMMLKCLFLLLKPCRFTDVTAVISIFWWIKNCIVDKHYLQIDCLCSFLFLVFIRTWSKTARGFFPSSDNLGLSESKSRGTSRCQPWFFGGFSLVISHEISWYPSDLGCSWMFQLSDFDTDHIFSMVNCHINCHQYTLCDFANGMVISHMVGLHFFHLPNTPGESQVDRPDGHRPRRRYHWVSITR